ncbi:MAG: hypothetical protein CL607_10560 [Anaerolineaceae bacterium]|nr:hypothetical protein [Anaerolineaceae bacterium]
MAKKPLLAFTNRFLQSLMWLYPPSFRREYGDAMQSIYDDMCSDAVVRQGTLGLLFVLLKAVADTALSAIREWMSAWEHTKIMTLERIDEYEIKQIIGEGSAATVYLAHDPLQDRDVVVKLLNPEWAQKSDGIANEAEAMQIAGHKSIPTVYKTVSRDDAQYLVMDYLQGQTALDCLAAGDILEKEVIAWGIAICDVLHHLHTLPQPYLYRDVKPGNIMVDGDSVSLIDFGIAVPYEIDGDYDKIGTIGYSAPEQYVGRVDFRSEVYALGATLYHLATGRDPRKEHSQFLFHFLPPRQLKPSLSAALEQVILRATEHKPEDRYQTIADMRAALLACRLDDGPTERLS